MYRKYFGLTEKPFSLAPDPRFLYLSAVHEEALAHLLYGVSEGGGIVLLTGEVGTGKTAMCRCLLNQLPDNVDLALILNPNLTSAELVESICEELEIDFPKGTGSLKILIDRLGTHLREAHAQGRNSVVMIDEAQNLTPELMEQLRLLTNLETEKQKLLQIILVGQPELNGLLARTDMRQVFQRVTARFHLQPLDLNDTKAYIRHRLAVAGMTAPLFNSGAMTVIHKVSGGIPRLINSLCDRCLLAAYADNRKDIDRRAARSAATEVLGGAARMPRRWVLPWAGAAGLAAALAFLIVGPVNLDPAVEALEGITAAWLIEENRDAAGSPDAAAAQTDFVASSVQETAADAPPSPEDTVEDAPVSVEALEGITAAWLIEENRDAAGPPDAAAAQTDFAASSVQETAADAPPSPEDTVEDAPVSDEADVLETAAPPEGIATQRRPAEPVEAVVDDIAAPAPILSETEPVHDPEAGPEPANYSEAPSVTEAVETAVLTLPEIPAAVPREAPELVKLEDLFQLDGGDRKATYANLFDAWSSDYLSLTGAGPCRKALDAGLTCLEENEPWQRLESLNRPALIALYNSRGQELHAVVRAIDGDRVTLNVAGRRVVAERDRLIYYWSGKFVVLWRPPKSYRRVMKLGQRGEDIAWLRRRLSDILGLSAGAASATFDSELEDLVMTFQRSRNLRDDGVAGPRTLIHLNTAAKDPSIPLLKRP